MNADLIIRDGLVVTMDEARRVIEGGCVVSAGGRIVAVGDGAVADQYTAATVIDAGGGIVMPGMINTHCHAGMTVFRGLADDVPDRLQRYIFPLEARVVDADLTYWSSLLGIMEMLEAGVTTFADMFYFEEEVARAADEAGIRAVVGQTVIGFAAPDCATPDEAIARTLKTAAAFAGHDRVRVALGPHAPYSLSEAELRRVADAARDGDLAVLMHLAETADEQDTIRRDHGMTPVAYAQAVGLLDARLTAAHCIHVDDDDMARLADSGAGVSHNPVSNAKAGKGVAPVLSMAARGIPVGLGTDGAMSGNTLDVVGLMGATAKIQKLAAGDRRVAPAVDVVAMATIDGARALHMADDVGSLEVGKWADVAVVDTGATHMRPVYDPYAALVYAARASDVRTTVVGGDVVMHEGRVRSLSPDDVYREAGRLAGGIGRIAATL